MVCDIVVADETARFGTPEAGCRASFPGPGVVRGRAHLNLHALKYMIFTGAVARRAAGARGGPRQRGRPRGRAPRAGGGVGRPRSPQKRAARARGGEGDAQRRRAGSALPHAVDAVAMLQGSEDFARGHRRLQRAARAAVRGPMSDDGRARPRAQAWRTARRARAPARGGARDGRAGAGRAASRVRPADGARAPRRARRPGFLLRARAAGRAGAPPRRSRPRPTRSWPGFARIDGRKVCVIAVDATVLAGTTGQVNMRKQNRVALWAGRARPAADLPQRQRRRPHPRRDGLALLGAPVRLQHVRPGARGRPEVPRLIAVARRELRRLRAARGDGALRRDDEGLGDRALRPARDRGRDRRGADAPTSSAARRSPAEQSGNAHLVVDDEQAAGAGGAQACARSDAARSARRRPCRAPPRGCA